MKNMKIMLAVKVASWALSDGLGVLRSKAFAALMQCITFYMFITCIDMLLYKFV